MSKTSRFAPSVALDASIVGSDRRLRGRVWSLQELLERTNELIAQRNAQEGIALADVKLPTLKQLSSQGAFHGASLEQAAMKASARAKRRSPPAPRPSEQAQISHGGFEQQETKQMLQQVLLRMGHLEEQMASSRPSTQPAQQAGTDSADTLAKILSRLGGLDDIRRSVMRLQDQLAHPAHQQSPHQAASAQIDQTLDVARIANRLGRIEETQRIILDMLTEK